MGRPEHYITSVAQLFLQPAPIGGGALKTAKLCVTQSSAAKYTYVLYICIKMNSSVYSSQLISILFYSGHLGRCKIIRLLVRLEQNIQVTKKAATKYSDHWVGQTRYLFRSLQNIQALSPKKIPGK